MDYYAGLDVSLRSCALCIVDEKGSVRLERELPCEIEAIAGAWRISPIRWPGSVSKRGR